MQSIILFGIKCQAEYYFESSFSDAHVNEHSMKIEILLSKKSNFTKCQSGVSGVFIFEVANQQLDVKCLRIDNLLSAFKVATILFHILHLPFDDLVLSRKK